MSNLWSAASLSPEWFWKPELYEIEQKTIFYNNWIFAGFKHDIAENNGYISTTIAGTPVIIRNMKNELVAFVNVCSHRQSAIHPDGCGKSMFRCPYHGWTYDAKGVPIGIPDNDASFGLDKEQKKFLALTPVSVDTCGNFIFVRLAPRGKSLEKWLGPLAKNLKQLSKFQPRQYGKLDVIWESNWKCPVEITLEGYHAPLVHPQSFAAHLGLQEVPDTENSELSVQSVVSARPTEDINCFNFIKYLNPHSIARGPISSDSTHHLNTIAKRLHMRRSDQYRGFDHYAIYPNFMIGVNEGVNTCIQLYMPISAERTRSICWLMTGASETNLENGVIWQAATNRWNKWTEATVYEDQVACERVQVGVRHTSRKAHIGKCEERIAHLQSMWLKDVQKESKSIKTKKMPLRMAS